MNNIFCTMKWFPYIALGLLCVACKPVTNQPDTPPATNDTTIQTDTVPQSLSTRQEQYRPQIHYTVHHNWMNDPNGMVFDGTRWHLYYQFNPNGENVDFGGMSWGHASSIDLVHWEEHETVLYPDEMGSIFSGCGIIDKRNVSGFGENSILAFYTSAAGYQQISLAVSTDGGMTYQKYAGNPVVGSSLPEFRDPKVVWDEDHQKYVMTIARGNQHGLEIWSSTNLVNWQFHGIFFYPDLARFNNGQWECPELIPFEVNGERQWVMLMSINPGGKYGFSGMLYWLGTFDGNMFYPTEEPRWLDGGMDCYAGVTFDNAPNNERIMMAWMNSWDYCTVVPPRPWKSAFTFPRTLTLEERQGNLVLCQRPIAQLRSLRVDSAQVVDAWMAEMTVSMAENTDIVLFNDQGEEYTITVDVQNNRLVAHRTAQSGAYLFSANFAIPTMSQPLSGIDGVPYEASTLDLTIIVDHSSVEVFANNGACTITNTVYPTSIYSDLVLSTNPVSLQRTNLETIWK